MSALLDQALDLAGDERAAWLAGLGGADAALRPQLEQMLADADPGLPNELNALNVLSVLDALPHLAQVAAEARLAHAAAQPGPQQVGPYRLLSPLGRGGMGTVWLAERVDGALQRAVALKLPNTETLYHPGLARRFERERDILAALEHPNIARLYDAGATESGQPYLALEYVEGLPITRYCDEQQMPLRERIELFLQVLEAVQYAHSRLVVHRDLKPSNIFVTCGDRHHGEVATNAAPHPANTQSKVPNGQVRLLDFGIAALLEEGDATSAATNTAHAARTEWTAHTPMTPDYASPEQIARQPIGTASDVYSLGVVFYELLTGQRPYRLSRNTRGALEDAILAVEPTRPSRLAPSETAALRRAQRPEGLQRQLRGDLENMALMALRKNAAERYPSAEAFKQDIQRWLDHRPVLAHPGGWGYRARKFIQRNQWPVAASALAAVGVVAGLAVALNQAAVAQRESQRAHAAQDFLVGLFNEADPARAQGRELTVRDLMTKGEHDLQDKLNTQPALRAELSGVLAGIYLKLGDAYRALPLAERRRDLSTQVHGVDSPEYAEAQVALGEIQDWLGQREAALHTLSVARPAAERLRQSHPKLLLDLNLLEAQALLALQRYDRALKLLGEAVPEVVRLYGTGSFTEASVRMNILTSLASTGREVEAGRALADLEPLIERDWPEEGMSVAAMRSDIGYIQLRMRRYAEAIRSLERAIAESDRLAGPLNSQSIGAARILGVVYLHSGRFAEADRVFAGNVERSRQFHGEESSETGLNLSFRVMALQHVGPFDLAEAVARRSMRLAQLSNTMLTAPEIRDVQQRLCAALLAHGKPAEALMEIDELLARERDAEDPADARQATAMMYRGIALTLLGRHREATAAAEAAVGAWRAAGSQAGGSSSASPVALGLARGQLNAALAWLAAAQPDRAAPFLDEGEAGLRAVHSPPSAGPNPGPHPHQHPDVHLAALVRAQWLRATGRSTDADAMQQAARERYKALSGVEAPSPPRFVF